MKAVEKGNMRLARFALEKGADVRFRDSQGRTPLSIGAARSDQAVMELLRKYGARE